ncbi:MAG: acetate--CoA ligase family protein [Hyphomicrobiales bacterium]|nr:acetate--CoA ligase family protein [Hyphomicrobiales bacterium]
MIDRQRDVTPLVQPRSVAVLGASANRRTQGNGVIQNLQKSGYRGRIIPIHPTAEAVDGLSAASAIERLPRDTDLAVVAIPAPGVTASLAELNRAGVRSAMVFTNGFSLAEESAFRHFAGTSAMMIHGPNCMGLINVSDQLPLYPSTITEKVQRGKVALIAQSGSAAISLMNSTNVGFSKVVTMGSEFQVTAPDYMRWLAGDEETSVIGIVLEQIKDPADFARAVASLHVAGKAVVALKVGSSDVGALAVQAHTGALISRNDAYECFFTRCGVPTVADYDEMVATLECFASRLATRLGSRLGIVGISGGETALACDLAAQLKIPIAAWSEATTARVKAAQPGSSGRNPLDLGATVHHTVEQDAEAIDAIVEDAEVDAVVFIQDAQGTLTPTMLGNYLPRIESYGRHGEKTAKPVVLLSPTSENTHPKIAELLTPYGVPVLRGLRNGLVAMRNLGIQAQALKTAKDRPSGRGRIRRKGAAAWIARELAGRSGALPAELTARILTEYDIPLVGSALVRSGKEAEEEAARIGYPLVVKIASPDIPHRSDIGGVELGIQNPKMLRQALERISKRVSEARPDAHIEGFELQPALTQRIEAMAGFLAAPPFGALVLVGTGGTLVELEADRAVGLSPLSRAEASGMIRRTRLGALLGGYRNLVARTNIAELAKLLANLSRLALDLHEHIAECDLNPVLLREVSGEVAVVDALLVAGNPFDPVINREEVTSKTSSAVTGCASSTLKAQVS